MVQALDVAPPRQPPPLNAIPRPANAPARAPPKPGWRGGGWRRGGWGPGLALGLAARSDLSGLLRRAVDIGDLHDRRTRNARSVAGAIICLPTTRSVRDADRPSGGSFGELSRAAVQGRRRCGADF